MSAATNTVPTISVVVCAYTLDRWSALQAALASLEAQTVARARSSS